MRIGVVNEGFGRPESEPDVDQKVREAAERLRALGAIVEDGLDPDAPATARRIWTPIALEGLQAQMMHGNGMGFNWKGLYTTSLLDAHANWRARANELSRTLKISMLVGEYFIKHYRGHFYAKAQNLARAAAQGLRRRAGALRPAADADAADEGDAAAAGRMRRSRCGASAPSRCCRNTCPFDVTGHPAMSVPCGMSQGLPIGMMLIGKHYDEIDDLPRGARLRAARATGATSDCRRHRTRPPMPDSQPVQLRTGCDGNADDRLRPPRHAVLRRRRDRRSADAS